jgi:hypothetical protein
MSLSHLSISLVLALGACHPGGSGDGISALEADLLSGVNTVVELSWTSDSEGVSWVEFGLDEQREGATPTSEFSDVNHSVLLLGLPAFSTVHYEVFTQTEEALYSQQGQIETGGLPAGLPDFHNVVHDASAVSPERWLLSLVLGSENYLVVLDRAGQVVWYQELSEEWDEHLVMCLDFVMEGRGLVYGVFSGEPRANPSFALYTGWDGVERGRRMLESAHHDLAEHPDGSIATIRSRWETWVDPATDQEVQVAGDALVSIAPDGTTRKLFDAFEWAEITAHDRFYHPGNDTADWTHANAVRYVPDSDTYLMSMGNLDTVVEISASTGALLREFGPGGYAVGQGTPFVFQHDPHWTEAGTLLMSSSIGDSDRLMAIEYAVNEEQGTLEEVWSYGKDQDFSSVASGHAVRMGNGNTLLNTGYNGVLVEVSPEGEPVWELSSTMGGVFLSVVAFDDFYSR